jgi:histidine ammonia-lyase
MTETIQLTPGALSFGQLRGFANDAQRIVLDPGCWPAVEAAAEVVERAAGGTAPVYGINTGFGKLATVRIAPDQIEELQRRLVLSHMCGLGPALPDPVVRLVLALKATSLALGYSGVRRRTIELLLALINHDALPVIPAKGSVGASGDLAPLAHLAGTLIGVGEVRLDGTVLPAAEALARIGEQPLTLAAKEGLAFLNGTQVSTALALVGLFRAQAVFDAALVAGAMSVDAALGSDVPFDPRLNAVRGQPAQMRVAERLHALLAGSQIRASHLVECERVQDPYSLRCQPQVMGACLDQMRHAARAFEIESAAVTDNPVVFFEKDEILSGGNFHAEPVALAADVLALAIAEIGALSERRIALLIDSSLSGLPPFLVEHGGVNSGFMVAQVTAAALAAENKSLAHPASVDSLPTSANQEDHVSMATFAARRLTDMVENSAGIVAIELIAAAQGIDFRAPLKTSARLQEAHVLVRERVAFYDHDRYFAPDITAIRALVESGVFHRFVPGLLPTSFPSSSTEEVKWG